MKIKNLKLKTIFVLPLLILFLTVLTVNVNAQTEGDSIVKVLNFAEEMPEYPGGRDSLNQDIANSLVYPEEAVKIDIQGTVYLRFIVNKDGNIENAEVVRGVDPLLDKEALKVINSLNKKWKPGKQNGKIVNVYMILPLFFVLNHD